jgi:peptide/nickel transport system ATP-binding protein
MIDVSALTVRFRTKTGYFDAVREASFHVGEGEVFGLVGESGSGKSTVLHALTGLAPIAGGHMKIGSHVIGEKSNRSFRRDMQMVFQDPYGSRKV